MRHLRQQDAVNMNKLSQLRITMIGAGAIGSTTALWLGKMGVNDIWIFDDDKVEEHNWSNQMFRASDIGKPKCQALFDVMHEFGMQTPMVRLEKFVDRPLSTVTISCVYSMASRKAIWKAVRQQTGIQLYIDARMGLETLRVFAFNPMVREERVKYAKSLYSDVSALQEPCTARTICYTPLMASAVICNLVKRFVNGEGIPAQVVMDLATYTTLNL